MTAYSYAAEQKQLMKDFDKMIKHARRVFESRYGKDFTGKTIPEIRLEYKALIPQIPYIGNRKPFTQWLFATAQFLAMYRALKRRGKSAEEAGRIGSRSWQRSESM